MNNDLKPCPFCGGEAHLSNWSDGAYVWCECGVKTEVYLHSGCVDKAVEAWNRRVATDKNVGDKERTAKVVCNGTTMGLSFCCGNCGKPVHSEGKYCHHCGAKLDWSEL